MFSLHPFFKLLLCPYPNPKLSSRSSSHAPQSIPILPRASFANTLEQEQIHPNPATALLLLLPKPLIFCTFSTDPSLQSYPINTCNTEAKRDRNFSNNNLQFSTTTDVQTTRNKPISTQGPTNTTRQLSSKPNPIAPTTRKHYTSTHINGSTTQSRFSKEEEVKKFYFCLFFRSRILGLEFVIFGYENRKRTRNRVETKKIERKGSILAPTRRRRLPRIGRPPRRTSSRRPTPVGKEKRNRRENRAILGRKE